MLMVLILFVSLTATGNCQCSQQLVNKINGLATTWTAQRNLDSFTTGQMPAACDTMDPGKMPMKEVQLMSEIPTEFDARVKWSHCQTIINSIMNQGSCGGCWAFGIAGMMSDRICTCDLGNVQLSPQNLITCCAPKKNMPDGCEGIPMLSDAFECWIDDGIVTKGCQPYTLEDGGVPPKCSSTCSSDYSKSYSDDLYYGKRYYQIDKPDGATIVATIQSEIMKNGPIAVGFTLYEDFYCYGSGVYQHVTGDLLGKHLVKLIGWGEENGVPYWLLANSWGIKWGASDGFFKVRRGVNEVEIESMPIAGRPNRDASSGVPSLNMLMLWIIAYLLS